MFLSVKTLLLPLSRRRLCWQQNQYSCDHRQGYIAHHLYLFCVIAALLLSATDTPAATITVTNNQ